MGLDSDIVDINENYINYINYNPKPIKETNVDELAVAETGATGHYPTLDSTYDNKEIAVITLPTRMQNGEIITATHMALFSKTDLPTEARKVHLFQVSTKLCYQLELFAITDANQYLMTINDSFSITGMRKK